MNPNAIFSEIALIGPANTLLITGILMLIAGFFRNLFTRKTLSFFCLGSIGLASIWLAQSEPLQLDDATLFAADSISLTSGWLSLLGGALVVLIGWNAVPINKESEYYSCLLFLLAGILYTGFAKDLTTLFLGLELVSIPTIVLLGISSGDDAGRESTLKYFTLSAFSSGFFLLGCSYLYGAAGTTNLQAIAECENNALMLKVGLSLSVGAMFFRLTAVPFHFYAPDLFAGANLSLVSGLAFLPKLTGIVGILRLLSGSQHYSSAAVALIPLLIVAAALTMTVGNFAALRQTCVRRIFAYSGVAHSGYLLAGIGSMIAMDGGAAILTDYLAAYAVMSFALFATLILIERSSTTNVSNVTAFDGLYKRNPWLAIMATVALFSQIGLPPTAGFWAKFQVFVSAISTDRFDLRTLAIIMSINAAIGAVVYLGLATRMFQTTELSTNVDDTQPALAESVLAPKLACLICTALTIVWFVIP